MGEVYLIRIILDTEEDVIRDIAVTSDSTLMDLHNAVVAAFGLNPGEMSSFFKSNDNWEQGEEISMMDFDPEVKKNPLEKTQLSESFGKKGARMLFAYDFLNLWTFYMEVMNVQKANPDKNYPLLIGKLGETPDKAPDRQMSAEEDDLLNGNNADDDDELDGDDFSQQDWF